VLAVARELHFRKAAEKLHVSQPAVSRQVRQCEEEFGFEILRRDHHFVSLTKAGRSFVTDLDAILNHFDNDLHQAITKAQAISRQTALEYAIAHSPYAPPAIRRAALRLQQRIFRKFQLRFRILSTTELITALHHDVIQAGITFAPIRRFNEKALQELAVNFATQGIVQPLIVRAIDDGKYEVVAGSRRFRAAQLAELKEAPVIVRVLSDAAVRELQLTENLLREDVHPYEEALALQGLLQLEGAQYDVVSIASRLGKSPAYITTRIRLTELSPSIAEAFLADEIGVGHALEIAKLPQAEQQKAFDAAFRSVWNGTTQSSVLLPLRDFTAWIEQNIMLSLDKVPFDKDDAALVPESGSCASCPKRTAFNTLLFGELSQRDHCTDAACLNNKLARFVERQIEARPKLVQISTAYGGRVEGAVLARSRYIALHLAKPGKSKQPLSPQQKPCKHMAEAIVVEGLERGHIGKVCAEPTCAVHFPGRNSKAGGEAQLAREREQRRKELEKRKLEVTIRHRILAEVLKKVGAPLDRADLVLIANAMLDRIEPLGREALARRHKVVEGASTDYTFPQVQKGLQRLLRQSDENGLSKLIVEIVLLGSVESAPQADADPLTATAKRHRVDVAKVRTAVEAEFAVKQAKAAAKQKKAATKTTKVTKAA
jgi:ParB family transcriptional regulator, chromosome partitioning protein